MQSFPVLFENLTRGRDRDKRPTARLGHAATYQDTSGKRRFRLYYSAKTGKARDEFAGDSLHRQTSFIFSELGAHLATAKRRTLRRAGFPRLHHTTNSGASLLPQQTPHLAAYFLANKEGDTRDEGVGLNAGPLWLLLAEVAAQVDIVLETTIRARQPQGMVVVAQTWRMTALLGAVSRSMKHTAIPSATPSKATLRTLGSPNASATPPAM